MKKKAPNKAFLILVSILFLAVLGITLAVYFPGNDEVAESATESLEQTSFEGRGYDSPFKIDAEKTLVPEDNQESEGSVDDLRDEDDQPETLPDEEVTESGEASESAAEEEEKEQPVNLETLIANSISSVYTIYTDLEQGSGFLFNEQGDIVTNAHVVKDASYVTVMGSDGEFYDGQVVGVSKTTDIALIRVIGLEGKKPLAMEESEATVNTPVFTLGSPGNVNNTSTIGEITAVGKDFTDVYQYDGLYEMTAEIKQGSSGGPLISAQTGKIIGINSIVLTDDPKIGYAIPLHTVMPQLEEWAAKDLPVEEEAEVVMPNIEDAYLSEELLRNFMTDFYDLIAPSLEYQEGHYYRYFLLEGSQAETAAVEMVEGMKSENRTFQSVETSISDVEIHDDRAEVFISANFTFIDPADDKLVSISHSYVYEVVIDEFGDYQIQSMRNQN
ncbi:S1C family serine protease [Metaplanococcus flavidus]|uniref:S1C family serine protease n=1 Tax=Metaplanococcus flavidus TaxID=569883 RepID=A0ABW3LEV1_9BACL